MAQTELDLPLTAVIQSTTRLRPIFLALTIGGALNLFACAADDAEEQLPPAPGPLGSFDASVVAPPGASSPTGATGGTPVAGPGSVTGGVAGSSAGTGAMMGTAGGASPGSGAMAGTGATAGAGVMAGTGATAGAGAIAGTGGTGANGSDRDGGVDAGPGASTGGDAGMMRMDLGQGDGKDVITIGDSYMSLFLTGIQQSLEKVSMRDYRNYAFPGTLVLNEQIPQQYLDAKREDPDIKTVVMTGGGNDILTQTCSGNCASIVDDVAARLTKLIEDMGKDGVQDVVLIGYGYPADQSRHASLDYSRMLSPKTCNKGAMPRCHYIDPVKELMGKISSDGIHPTSEGYDILGKMAWELMKAEGMRR